MKAFIQRALACVCVLFLAAASSNNSTQEYYVDVPYEGPGAIGNLVDKGLDLVGIDQDRRLATFLMRGNEMGKLSILDVKSKRPVFAPDSNYKKPADIERILMEVQAKYPDLAYVESIGKSGEGRDIFAINISNRNNLRLKPTVLFDAMHHAREVMTPEVALDIVTYLTDNFATDPRIKKWLNSYSIWVVPMLNPDGNNKVWTSDSMWRKNNEGGYGVDVNRNYPYAWKTCNGSSGLKSSETYRGPSAGSERETNALMDLAKRLRPVFNISYHSASEIVIYPYGCSPNRIPDPDRAVYETVGKELASKLVRDSGSGTYTAGTSYQLLYNVDGGSVDWMYSQDKIMSFVVEINSSIQGFQPSFKQWRDITVQRQRPGWMYILDRMSGPGIR